MKDDWLKEIEVIIKNSTKDDLLNKMKSMIKEELTIEKENLNEAVRNIKIWKKKMFIKQ